MVWICRHANFWLRSELGVSPSCSREWTQCLPVGKRRPNPGRGCVHHHEERRTSMAFGNGAISNCPLPFITYALFTPLPPLAEPPHPRRSQPISQTTKYLGKKRRWKENVTVIPISAWLIGMFTVLQYWISIQAKIHDNRNKQPEYTRHPRSNTYSFWRSLVKNLTCFSSLLTRQTKPNAEYVLHNSSVYERSWKNGTRRRAWEDNIQVDLSYVTCKLVWT